MLRRTRYSPKRAALESAFRRPWREVALEFEARSDLRLADIADEWTRQVRRSGSPFGFSTQDVSKIIRRARDEKRGRNLPEPLAAALETVGGVTTSTAVER